MTAQYNVLDNIQKAIDLSTLIKLEEADLTATLDYEASLQPDEWNEPENERDESNYLHLKSLRDLHAALLEYLRHKQPGSPDQNV